MNSYDFAPVRRSRLGRMGRLGVVLAVLGAICALMGFKLTYASTVDQESFALLWFMLSFGFGFVGVSLFTVRWVLAGGR